MTHYYITIEFDCDECGAPLEKEGELSENIVCDECGKEYNVAIDVHITQK